MLSDRQIKLLEAIINEYITNPSPVGSSLIVEKYDINFSPATIRNEMAKLLEQGYLEMLHTSSGRVPTKEAYKLFLDQLMQEEDLDVLQEIALKQRLWANRYEFEKLLRQGAHSLSELVGLLVIATTEDGHVFSSGMASLLDYPEFWDVKTLQSLFFMLDRHEVLTDIFDNVHLTSKNVGYLIGTELGHSSFKDTALILTKYRSVKRSGYLAVIGPARMSYSRVIPTLRYANSLISELGGTW